MGSKGSAPASPPLTSMAPCTTSSKMLCTSGTSCPQTDGSCQLFQILLELAAGCNNHCPMLASLQAVHDVCCMLWFYMVSVCDMKKLTQLVWYYRTASSNSWLFTTRHVSRGGSPEAPSQIPHVVSNAQLHLIQHA